VILGSTAEAHRSRTVRIDLIRLRSTMAGPDESTAQPVVGEAPECPIDVPLGTTSGSLGRAFILASLTGMVDAGVFLKTGVLPSVMTANTIFVGLWLVLGRWSSFVLAALAVVTFLLASMVAARVVRDFVDRTAQVQHRLAWFEFTALALLAGVGLLELFGVYPWPGSNYTLPVVVLATAAMALQMPQVRKVEDIGVSTLFTTGAIAGLAYDLADGRKGPKARRHERLYLMLIGSYAIGGAMGGLLSLIGTGAALVAPVVVFAAAWAWRLASVRRAAQG
jgi:uncharacterized membrane protein YoaK (UPF0700 family)